MKLIKDSPREFQEVTDPHKIFYILENHTGCDSLWLKNTYPSTPLGYVDKNAQEGTITLKITPGVQVGKQFCIFRTLSKQIEFDLDTVESNEGTLVGRFYRARIYNAHRSQKRIAIPTGAVIARHFTLSKNRIDLNQLTPLVSNKIIFHEVKKKMRQKYPGLEIRDFGLENDSLEARYLKKTVKPIYVSDTSNPQSYRGRENFLDYFVILRDDLEKTMKRFRDTGIKSIVFYPIVYENMLQEKFPIGYLEIPGTERQLSDNDLEIIRAEAADIVEKIKDANTLDIECDQKVANVSTKGAAIIITNRDLKELIRQRDSLLFNIIFKLQAPLRMLGKIRYILEEQLEDENSFVVGIEFAGKAFNEVRTTIENCVSALSK